MLAIASRMYSIETGIVYVLVDINGKIHVEISEDKLYKIKDNIANYSIAYKHRNQQVMPRCWYLAELILSNSKLELKTTDYFDLRDITVEMYYARISTMLAVGKSKREVVQYEVQKWLEKDRPEYHDSDWMIVQAVQYLRIKAG